MSDELLEIGIAILECCWSSGGGGERGLDYLDLKRDDDSQEEILVPWAVINRLRIAVADASRDESWRPKDES